WTPTLQTALEIVIQVADAYGPQKTMTAKAQIDVSVRTSNRLFNCAMQTFDGNEQSASVVGSALKAIVGACVSLYPGTSTNP
ncbi:MAG: hypothetical protein ABJB66_14940, partial [Gemmatimonadaceae bacterium]